MKSRFLVFLSSHEGVSFLEDKEDIFEDWREKFFNTWKVSVEEPALLTD